MPFAHRALALLGAIAYGFGWLALGTAVASIAAEFFLISATAFLVAFAVAPRRAA
jgi:hypothetical protein